MTNSFGLPRKLIIFAIVLPLAALIGYQLGDPDFGSLLLTVLVASVLAIPLLLRWHHPLLIVSWNAAIQVFFIPGQPQLWLLMTGISLGLSVGARFIVKRDPGTFVPSLVWPLLFIAVVVVVTTKLTGGVGLQILGGSSFGGKRLVYIAGAILGFFALSAQRIPTAKVQLFSGLYLLSSVTAAIGHVLYYLGPNFWFLFAVFPVGYATYQAFADFTGSDMVRFAGLTFAGMGICKYLLCRFGVSGLLRLDRPVRAPLFCLSLFVTLLGGFRSGLLTIAILCTVLFILEGLHRTRLAIALVIGVILASVAIVPLASRMPLSIQRTLAFLPIEVSPVARADALASSEWRLKMWKVVWLEVPKHLLLGKGTSLSPTDMYLAGEALRRGQAEEFETALVAGDYHNAPLTLVIQFGLWGIAAFLWFVIASWRVLYRNYAFSPPELKTVNRFLFGFFITICVCFLFLTGSFAEHFYVFTGIVGFSVSLNGGMRSNSQNGSPRREPQGSCA